MRRGRTHRGVYAHWHVGALISKERPVVPVVAYTPFEQVYRRLALWWGVMPRRSELLGTTEQLISWVDEQLQEEGLVHRGRRSGDYGRHARRGQRSHQLRQTPAHRRRSEVAPTIPQASQRCATGGNAPRARAPRQHRGCQPTTPWESQRAFPAECPNPSPRQ